MEEELAPVGATIDRKHSLEDLKIGVQLRIGTTTLPLRNILNMKVGEVVALDRQIAAPVQVLAGGRMVATGELVIANGFYAIQITQVSALEIHLLEDAPVY